MTSFYKRCAQALIGLGLAIALPKQKEWARAMKAELAHLPDRNALPFALGCVAALVKERVYSDAFILFFGRQLLVISAVIWSAAHIWLATRFSSIGDETPAALSYIASACIAVGAVITAKHGLRVAAKLICPVLLTAAMVGSAGQELLPTSPHNQFYQAIALEYALLLSMALLISAGLPYWIETRKRERL
ncbi:hypothetical protein N8940_00505 [Sphingomonadaceae bacterium]|nr:hypothetical protein [Sphingomonadaceae bacterium]